MKNFLIGMVSTLSINTGITEQLPDITNLAQSTPELIGSVVAGIASTVIINILKAKFPKLFRKAKNQKYYTDGKS